MKTRRYSPLAPLPDPREKLATPSDTPIDQAYLWQRIQRFIRADDVVVVENGTSGAAIGGMRMPGGVKVVNQPIWGFDRLYPCRRCSAP